MPGPWRPDTGNISSAFLIVSISDEMPGPWRRPPHKNIVPNQVAVSISDEMPGPWRQEHRRYIQRRQGRVSISDEMPGPWRLCRPLAEWAGLESFNLRRDARPLATLPANQHTTNNIEVSI